MNKYSQLNLQDNKRTTHPLPTISGVLKRVSQTNARLMRAVDGSVGILTDDARLIADFDHLKDSIAVEVTPAISADQRRAAHDLLEGYKIEFVTTNSYASEIVTLLLVASTETGCLAFDTETAVLPELLAPVQVALTRTGTVAKRQPKTGSGGYALNPRKSRVRLLQAHAGGDLIALFDMSLIDWSVVAPLFHDVPALAAFNAVFDVKFLLAGSGIEPTARIYDTMTAMRLVDGTRNNMAQSAKAMLDIIVPKGLGASDWHRKDLTSDQLNYAAVDAIVTFWMWQVQRDHFDEIDEHAQKLADELIVPVARMELSGLPINRYRHADKIAHWRESLTEAQTDMLRTTGGRLTGVPTNQRVADYVADTLTDNDLHDWPKTKTGALTVAQAALKNYGEKVPGIAELLAVRAWSKALSTYGDSLADHIDDDDRIRSSFLIAGARTGRFASRSVNLQNQPKRGKLLAGFRDIFEAKTGNLIIAADYSQIELRIAAELSGDDAMRDAFRSREDLHTRTARMVTGEDSPSSSDRTTAKAAAFGLLYGSGIRGFQKYAKASFGLDLTFNNASDLVHRFFDAYPQLKRWQRQQEQETRRGGDATTVGGRRWQFRWKSHSTEDKGFDDLDDWQVNDWLDGYERNFALNLPVQGTAAEIMGVALLYVDKGIRHLPARIGAIVHDEIVIECASDPATVRAVRRILAAKMTRAWLEFFPDAPWRGVIDITQGPSWGEQEEH